MTVDGRPVNGDGLDSSNTSTLHSPANIRVVVNDRDTAPIRTYARMGVFGDRLRGIR